VTTAVPSLEPVAWTHVALADAPIPASSSDRQRPVLDPQRVELEVQLPRFYWIESLGAPPWIRSGVRADVSNAPILSLDLDLTDHDAGHREPDPSAPCKPWGTEVRREALSDGVIASCIHRDALASAEDNWWIVRYAGFFDRDERRGDGRLAKRPNVTCTLSFFHEPTPKEWKYGWQICASMHLLSTRPVRVAGHVP
jgi:hypothetical protein